MKINVNAMAQLPAAKKKAANVAQKHVAASKKLKTQAAFKKAAFFLKIQKDK